MSHCRTCKAGLVDTAEPRPSDNLTWTQQKETREAATVDRIISNNQKCLTTVQTQISAKPEKLTFRRVTQTRNLVQVRNNHDALQTWTMVFCLNAKVSIRCCSLPLSFIFAMLVTHAKACKSCQVYRENILFKSEATNIPILSTLLPWLIKIVCYKSFLPSAKMLSKFTCTPSLAHHH